MLIVLSTRLHSCAHQVINPGQVHFSLTVYMLCVVTEPGCVTKILTAQTNLMNGIAMEHVVQNTSSARMVNVLSICGCVMLKMTVQTTVMKMKSFVLITPVHREGLGEFTARFCSHSFFPALFDILMLFFNDLYKPLFY